jgi:hypothetical protein
MLRAVVWPYYDVKTVEFVWLRLTITYSYDVVMTSGQSLTHLLVHAIFSTTGSHLTNAMFGIEPPNGRTPFQGVSFAIG